MRSLKGKCSGQPGNTRLSIRLSTSLTRANVSDPFEILPSSPGAASGLPYAHLNVDTGAFINDAGNSVTPSE